MIDWSAIRHFKRAEFPHDPDRVRPTVVMLLDEMREAAGVPIEIHEAWASDGHVDGSSHYDGWAVDCHFTDWPLLDQWLFAERFTWHGIGLYPYWRRAGLHLDLRPYGTEHPNLGRRWWRDRDGRYMPLDREFLALLLKRTQ